MKFKNAEEVRHITFKDVLIKGQKHYYSITNKLLGKGSFGKVYIGYRLLKEGDEFICVHQKKYAIKIVKDDSMAMAELTLMQHLSYDGDKEKCFPYIVCLYDWNISEDIFYIVMEYIENGKTLTLLSTSMFYENLTSLLKQSVTALEHIHRKGIVHIDIKGDNIMVDMTSSATPTIKFADFGLSCVLSSYEGSRTKIDKDTVYYINQCYDDQFRAGTSTHIDPLSMSERYHPNPFSDIYSLGVTFFYKITNEFPYKKDQENQSILSKKIYDPRIIHVITAMISLEERPTLNTILDYLTEKSLPTVKLEDVVTTLQKESDLRKQLPNFDIQQIYHLEGEKQRMNSQSVLEKMKRILLNWIVKIIPHIAPLSTKTSKHSDERLIIKCVSELVDIAVNDICKGFYNKNLYQTIGLAALLIACETLYKNKWYEYCKTHDVFIDAEYLSDGGALRFDIVLIRQNILAYTGGKGCNVINVIKDIDKKEYLHDEIALDNAIQEFKNLTI